MSPIEQAARQFLERGWVPIALEPDTEGRPKKPIADNWQNLTINDPLVRKQGWSRAKGVGVLCGPNSGNLAIIDIDHQSLAGALFAKLVRSHQPFRWVWTVRSRGHLYVTEEVPSEGRNVRGKWNGEEIRGELRCAGQQAAAPGTPGYILAAEKPPQHVESVGKAWDAICLAMGIEEEKYEGAGYPNSWQDMVGEGDRNNALFVEACRLASVRIPEDRAIELLTANIESHYSGHLKPIEIQRTVRSAYRRAYPRIAGPAENERYRREMR